MLLEQKIEELISKAIAQDSYQIVQVKYNNNILQLFIEKENGEAVNISDCEKVSKTVSTILDVEDIMSGRYFLEVSSPGLDRPLVKIDDYKRFLGHDVKVNLVNKINDSKKIKGQIFSVNDGRISFKQANGGDDIEVNFENILSAHLVPKIDFK